MNFFGSVVQDLARRRDEVEELVRAGRALQRARVGRKVDVLRHEALRARARLVERDGDRRREADDLAVHVVPHVADWPV